MKKKKIKVSKGSLNSAMEKAEEMSFSDSVSTVEDLSRSEDERDCFAEGEIDDKDVISRVRLF